MSLRAELISTALIICGLGAGCATEGPPPSDELTRAQTLIGQADKAGAQRYAAADLQHAHDELSDAQKANAEGKYDESRRYAESAAVDADVASAREAANEAEHAARAVAQSNEALRQESDRAAATANPNPQ